MIAIDGGRARSQEDRVAALKATKEAIEQVKKGIAADNENKKSVDDINE